MSRGDVEIEASSRMFSEEHKGVSVAPRGLWWLVASEMRGYVSPQSASRFARREG